MGTYTQWSTLSTFPKGDVDTWVPTEDRDRVAAYDVYDKMYWNDERAYSLRVMDGEDPVYIPNARTVVDTTSHYLLKDLVLQVQDSANHAQLQVRLDELLDREMFYARFHTAKHAGCAKGDFVFHMTADPLKTQYARISLNAVDASQIYPVWDDDQPDKMRACHIVAPTLRPDESGNLEVVVKKLTYVLEENNGIKKVSRVEGLYKQSPTWFSEDAENTSLIEVTKKFGYLDPAITTIPVYWFRNLPWGNNEYGSSDLRGLETLVRSISQGTTDTQGALALEGLGVYATDGGRPIDESGQETDWEVSPGRVMETPIGSRFYRVEGISSITPAKDQLERLEGKMHETSGLTAVALGTSDISIASSGIALAIQFEPTLAKIKERDVAGIGRLRQLFHDWQIWHQVFEGEVVEGIIDPVLGDKLPTNRVEYTNELNNMLDRRVISRQFYRDEMTRFGYTFPKNMEDDILLDVQLAAIATPASQEDGLNKAVNGNESNNSERPNESAGTEANDGEGERPSQPSESEA